MTIFQVIYKQEYKSKIKNIFSYIMLILINVREQTVKKTYKKIAKFWR